MKRLIASLTLALLVGVSRAETVGPLDPMKPLPLPPGVEAWIAPYDQIEDELIKVIEAAKVVILCSQYVMTSPRIIRALVDAYKNRSVVVAVILEAKPALREYQTPQYLRSFGIPVLLRKSAKGLNNHKFWVIDRGTVITGSYDCTLAAASGSNDENLLKVTEPGLAVLYYNAWLEQASRCTPLQ